MVDGGSRRVVTVPDVVGMPFHVGRDVAADAHVALASPDPDGPSINSLAWPGLFYIVRQDPIAGAALYEWDSVEVEIVAHGEAPDREPAPPRHPPLADSDHAHPTRAQHIDRADQ
jgi:hypothetical protein